MRGNVIRFCVEYDFADPQHFRLMNRCILELLRTKYPHAECEIQDVPYSLWHCRTEDELYSIFEDLKSAFIRAAKNENM